MLAALCGCSAGGLVPGGPHDLGTSSLDGIVSTASAQNGVSPQLLRAMIDAESGGDPSAISRAGAQGLMQLMPGTASAYGVADPFDPLDNVLGGSRYMHDLLARYRGDLPLALAAYNAGPGAVNAAGGIPAYPETRAYVARVQELLAAEH